MAKNAGLTAALDAARVAQAKMREAGTFERLDPIERSRRNPTSLRMAINGKCFDCQGGHADPGVRVRIRECPISRCTLHAVRPYQRRDDDDEDESGEAVTS